MEETCFCKSYYDENNSLQDCTCGKCKQEKLNEQLKKLYITENVGGKTEWLLSFDSPEFQSNNCILIDEETAKEILKLKEQKIITK